MLEVFGDQGLYVEACPFFDDSIIDYLVDTTIEENLSSPKINLLSLADCDGFTFVSMMRLVEARKVRRLARGDSGSASVVQKAYDSLRHTT